MTAVTQTPSIDAKLPIDIALAKCYHVYRQMADELAKDTGTMKQTITLTPEQFAEVQRIKRDGEPEWKAVATVLHIEGDTLFVTTALGTSSAPRDGLKVTFI